MEKLFLLLPMFILLFACERSPKEHSSVQPPPTAPLLSPKDTLRDKMGTYHIHEENIEAVIGMITFNEKFDFGDTVTVVDKQRNVLQYIVADDDDLILALKCLSKDSLYYKVVLERGDTGYIARRGNKVKFETLEKHVLQRFAVEFNTATNPLRTAPSEKADIIEDFHSKDDLYMPSAIRKNWLRVEWGERKSKHYGWVKWRDKHNLKVQLFYKC